MSRAKKARVMKTKPAGETKQPKINVRKSMGRLLRSLKNYKWLLVAIILLALLSATFLITGPKILGNITTEVANSLMNAFMSGSPVSVDFGKIGKIALTLLTLYIIAVTAEIISNIIMSKIAQKYSMEMRSRISRKINLLPMHYFDKHKFGDTLARITNDVDTITMTLTQGAFTGMIVSTLSIIGFLIMMFSISWQLSLIALASLPVSMMFIGFVTSKSQKYFKKAQDQNAEITAQAEEVYSGHEVIKAFDAETMMKEKFHRTNTGLRGSAFKSQFLSGLMFPIIHLIGNFSYVLVAIVGGGLAIDGQLAIGDIQAFIQYINQFNQPFGQIAQLMTMIQQTLAASDRVFDFLEEPNELVLDHYTKLATPLKGNIEFRDVVFTYAGTTEPVIKGLSFKVKAGQKVAIVGPTGAGKTTLVNLLMRFYDLSNGQILLDGIDIAKVRRSDVRQGFGMVLQQTWLMSDTLRNNLRYGKPGATDEEIMRVADATGIRHLIEALPQGLNTEINEDSEAVSVGEKQLLTIARAMLDNAPMMILDEATSNVDTRTEITIQRAMEKLTTGRTSFVIAHRLSTIRDADLILVMNHGNVVEQGTHKSLLAAKGFYAELYNSQFVEEAE